MIRDMTRGNVTRHLVSFSVPIILGNLFQLAYNAVDSIVVGRFAGTGALGLEAASRGASEVVLVEQEAHLVRALSKITTQLKASAVRVERGDGVSALRQRRGQAWDLVFIDPPFGEDGSAALFQTALEAARQAIHSEGEIYLEAPVVWTDEALAPLGLCIHRQSKAGAVAFHLLRPLASA